MPNSKRTIAVPVFAAILLAATLVAIELGAMALFYLAPDQFPARDAIQRSLAAHASRAKTEAETEADGPTVRSASNILHPYVGFVRNTLPGRENRLAGIQVDLDVNAFGFFGKSALAPKDDDVIRIAVTGGSVAEELFVYGRDTLRSELAQNAAFADQKIEIVSTAIAGFKQPQQLLALSYLLTIGADIDVVINLDGFNEVVLPFTDNLPLKLAPSYPFRWKSVAADGIDPGTATLVSRITDSERELREWRLLLDRFPLRHSSFVLAVWQVLLERNEASRSALEIALRDHLAEQTNLQAAPVFDPGPNGNLEFGLFEHSTAIWRRSSEALASLCASRGIAYLHFLQPNQYAVDSKHWTDDQRKTAILPSRNATRVAAETGYRLLIAEGDSLRAAGVQFVDLTPIFDRETEPIYRDLCCHYFERGYQIVARRMAEEIAAAVSDTRRTRGFESALTPASP